VHLRKILAVVFAAVLSPAVVLPAKAEVKWQMVTEYPQSNISGIGLTTFGELVAAKTNGAVTTTNAFDNQLKITSGQMIDAARDKKISGGDAFAGPLEAAEPIFGLASLPFVVQSMQVAKTANEKARSLYDKALRNHGLRLLYVTIWPSTGIWSDRPIKSPDDIKTLVVRAYDNNSAQVIRAVGAKAEFLPFGEAIEKVKRRELNAILTSGDGGAGRKLWDYLNHFSPINYAVPISIAFVRNDEFEALPKGVQEQVLAAASETEARQYDLLKNRTAENYDRMRSNGVAIDEPVSAEVIAALKAAAAAPVAAWKAKVSPEAIAIVDWANGQ
jgi:TRAP-type C4-dicarboxylate transport system substrate-binding protein